MASWGITATRLTSDRDPGAAPPSTSILPPCTRRNPAISEKRVVLPAPLGPTSPTTPSWSRFQSMRSIATLSPKRWLNCSIFSSEGESITGLPSEVEALR